MVRWLTGAGLLALAACADSATDTVADRTALTAEGWSIDIGGAFGGDLNEFFECLEMSDAALVSAHRGGPYPGYPENAVETMSALLAKIPAIM